MGSPKALLPWGSGTFVQHLCALLDTLSLTGAVISRPELAARLQVGWPIHLNADPERGMLSSLQVALEHTPANCPWLMVVLVDQPAILPETFRVMAAQASTRGWSSPVYEGRRGHPVVIGCECFASLRAARPDQTPREVLAQFPRTLVEVSDPGINLDFDTPEELQAFQTRRSSPEIVRFAGPAAQSRAVGGEQQANGQQLTQATTRAAAQHKAAQAHPEGGGA